MKLLGWGRSLKDWATEDKLLRRGKTESVSVSLCYTVNPQEQKNRELKYSHELCKFLLVYKMYKQNTEPNYEPEFDQPFICKNVTETNK